MGYTEFIDFKTLKATKYFQTRCRSTRCSKPFLYLYRASFHYLTIDSISLVSEKLTLLK